VGITQVVGEHVVRATRIERIVATARGAGRAA
jgi:hypothetical protein